MRGPRSLSLPLRCSLLGSSFKSRNTAAKNSDLESLRVSGFFDPSQSGFLGWLGGCSGGWVGLWVVVAKWAIGGG